MDTRTNNKVLSVSYGNFSCSVQGFDDSFEVMTSVVEFFRTLAQEDRYFGASPVQLTPELIAKLADKTHNADFEVTQATDNDSYNLTVRETSSPQMPKSAAPAAFALNERLKRLRSAEAENGAENENDLDELVSDPAPTAMSRPVVDLVTETAMDPTSVPEAHAKEDVPSDTPIESSDALSKDSSTAQSDEVEASDADEPSAAEPVAAKPAQLSETPPADAPTLTLEQRLRRIQAVTQKKRAEQNAAASATQTAMPNPGSETTLQPTAVDMDRHVSPSEPNGAQNDDDRDQSIRHKIDTPHRDGITHVVQVDTTSSLDDLDMNEHPESVQQEDETVSGIDQITADESTNNPTTDSIDTDTEAVEQEETPISLRQAPDTDQNGITPKRPERPTKRSSRNAENLERPSTEMLRLLKTAKEHMEEPETHRKRNALEHLRAAVAATLADNSILSRDKTKRERNNTTEDNIAPKRPVKPKTAAPDVPATPLVLQMDQRVDLDQSAPDATRA